jgi:hypothetical protein
MPIESGYGQVLRVGEVGGCTRPDKRGPAGRVVAILQRFSGNPSPLVSAAPWLDTSGAGLTRRRSRRRGSPPLSQAVLSGTG